MPVASMCCVRGAALQAGAAAEAAEAYPAAAAEAAVAAALEAGAPPPSASLHFRQWAAGALLPFAGV